MYNLSEGKEKEALVLIEKVYKETEDRDEILTELKRQVKRKSNVAESWYERVCGPKYIKATFVVFAFGSFGQWTGINMQMMFSNRIITESNKFVEEDKKILANRATVIIGIVAAISVMFSTQIIDKFKRKPLMQFGIIIDGISYFFMAYYFS